MFRITFLIIQNLLEFKKKMNIQLMTKMIKTENRAWKITDIYFQSDSWKFNCQTTKHWNHYWKLGRIRRFFLFWSQIVIFEGFFWFSLTNDNLNLQIKNMKFLGIHPNPKPQYSSDSRQFKPKKFKKRRNHWLFQTTR